MSTTTTFVSESASGTHAGPAFVMVGPLRAGTTLLRLLMNSHPRIAGCGEFEEAVSQAGNAGWPAVSWYRQWLSQDRASIAKGFEIDDSIEDYPSLVRTMWSQLAARSPKPLLGCTIHSRFDRVREIWPATKFIFMVRDPRDVARSCVGMGWVGEPTFGARYWIDPVRRWCRLREQLDSKDFIEVRYESLLRSPESVLDRCCQLLGERYDPAMIDFHRTSSYEALDPSLAEQWRRKMHPRTAEIIDSECREFMRRFGYETSVSNPRSARFIETQLRRGTNRLGRTRFRLRRYGLRTTLAWALVKRLRIDHPWRLRLRAEINSIDSRHLR